MASKYIYPKSIKRAYDEKPNPKGIGCHGTYQIVKNVAALKDNTASVAYWGDYTPQTTGKYKGVLRAYPNTITTFSGSWNIASPFTVTSWDIPSSIPNDAIVTKITLEYAIAQAHYDGWDNACKFYWSELTSAQKKFKDEETRTSPKNCEMPYKYILQNFAAKDIESVGKGLKEKQKIKNKKNYAKSDFNKHQYSDVIYKGSNAKLNIGKLKKSTLKAKFPRNLHGSIGRIVMQYIRLHVEYKEVAPAYTMEDIQITPSEITTCPESKARVVIKVKSTNGHTDTQTVTLSGSGVTSGTITNVDAGSKNTFKNNKWTIKSYSNGVATLKYDISYSQAGTYKTTATMGKLSKSKDVKVVSCRPTFDFQFLQENADTIGQDNHLPGGVYSTTATKFDKWYDYDDKTGFFKVIFEKESTNNDDEYIDITSGDLAIDWTTISTDTQQITITSIGKNKWRISNINDKTKVILHGFARFNIAGKYEVSATYTNKTHPTFNSTKKYDIIIKGLTRIAKDYFKIRLEDGSDVRYNSLMFTRGDDLEIPLTYTFEDTQNYIDNITIIGEKKRIPVNEIQYIQFEITLNTEKEIELTNVLSHIEVLCNGFRNDGIVIGTSKNVKLLENDNDEKICVIDSIKSTEKTIVKFAVISDEERECYIYLKPYNVKDPYIEKNNQASKWTPAQVKFKDIPNIKIWIEGISDLNTSIDGDKFSLYYHIQNLSDTAGKDIRFQIKEPQQFNKLSYSFYNDEEQLVENGANQNAPWFNPNNRIITFPILEPTADTNKDYRLRIDYQATKKGIYDFIIKTLDNPLSLEDDQYENYYSHQLLVDIFSDTKITTTVSKNTVYVNEVFDFHINVKNRFKDQKQFTFEIYDIGRYDEIKDDGDNSAPHLNHYEVQEPIEYDNGVFTRKDTEDNNNIGEWVLTNIKRDTENDLTVTLNPTEKGIHVIKTVFYDIDNNIKTFENIVRVIEEQKQIDFNVYQAVSDNDDNCSNCDNLDIICDNDFINLKDKIYYVFEIVNNNRKSIDNSIHVYARLPESFLTNDILCSSLNVIPHVQESDKLVSFSIPGLAGCKDENGKNKIKFCIKLEPSDVGNFVSNFMLSTRTAPVIHKQLKLTVDTEFNERKLEHEISIYNFDKTNKYYRYEIDNTGKIHKFFNTGDKSVRMIETESFNESAIEKYKGTNLRKLVRDIKDNSKYVDPLFLREGSNKLDDKGYELYPDGLIRRFGLLNSEIFHYSHQLPKTSNLVERAMKWDIDTWDTKVWAGDIYENGVFDLSIDYGKIPSNFNITNDDGTYSINNLQYIVNNAKPYGTQALCYYSATVLLKMAMFISGIKTATGSTSHLKLNILDENLGVISEYNRHDKSLSIYYDMFKLNINTIISDIALDMKTVSNYYDANVLSPSISSVGMTAYVARTDKRYIKDCYDIVSNIYQTKEKNNNVDIIKPYNEDKFTTNVLPAPLENQQIINFSNTLADKESIGLKVEESKTSIIYTYNPHFDDGIITVQDKNDILFTFERDDSNYFTGFKVIIEDEVVESYNIFDKIDNVSMQVQLCKYDQYNVLHFWGSINGKEYYHIGHLLSYGINKPIINLITGEAHAQKRVAPPTSYKCNVDNPVTFKLSDRVNITKKDFDHIEALEKNNKWSYLNNINKGHGKYAYFKNDINIDKACKEDYINVPKLIVKYNNIDMDETDEVVDIGFKIKTQSNKEDINDINIALYKDGDKYIPNNNIAKEIHYPARVTSVAQEFLRTFQLEQPNITICSTCLQTSLGYYEECQHCGSSYVYHSNEKTEATACHNCGYIVKGWHDHCTHCLSYDIEKIKIDYNKTYCLDKSHVTDGYYNYCPTCFTPNVIHLTNDKKVYQIFDESEQNIDPIIINTTDSYVNIFNLEIPFSYNDEELNELEYIHLVLHGTNHNKNKYYYCTSCGFAGIGNYHNCPHCNSKEVNNYEVNNDILTYYYKDIDNINEIIGQENISQNKFTTKIDLQEQADKNIYENFNILFYVEKQLYKETIEHILSLPIKDEYQQEIINEINKINISIDNISLDYKYKNAQEWTGLNDLFYDNHKGVIYNTPDGIEATNTEAIKFNKFDIERGRYENASLFIHGISKGTDSFNMNINITNNGQTFSQQYSITDNIFNNKINLKDIIGEYIEDISIEIFFSNVLPNSQITILDCNILTEKQQTKHIIHDNINDKTNIIHNNNLFTSTNIFGLKETKPYYISGRQLSTGLIAYIDFGQLNLQEYIRVYDIEMIILYKNKIGQLVTESIPVKDVGNIKIPNGVEIPADNRLPEQQVNGKIEKRNGEVWVSLKYPSEIDALNNLEYEITNINTDDELLNAIPLHSKIAQSFTLQNASEISKISIDYYNSRGYPSDIINIYLCEDDNNQPGRVIRANKVYINRINTNIDVDIDATDLQENARYWFVLEDNNTNEYNYHQFKYNNNTKIGQLIRYDGDIKVYDSNCVLSFRVDTNTDIQKTQTIPTYWSIDTDDAGLEYDNYKMYITFYRYNIQENSNISLSNLHISNGYTITSDNTEGEDEDED